MSSRDGQHTAWGKRAPNEELDRSELVRTGPKQSLDLIHRVAGELRGRVLDVGGGQPYLVDRLLDAGFKYIALLESSQTAIEATKARMGEFTPGVEWIAADITWRYSLGPCVLCHDRLMFHFITDSDDRQHHVEQLKRSLQASGHLIV